jgi:poly-gamma-glutamate synthesis protein (capsule biosynthesis protein)
MMDRSIRYRIESTGPSSVFAGVREPLRAADIAVANLETSIAHGGSPRAKGYTFRSPPLAVDALADGGIDVVSVANNHSLDFGPDALQETLALLASSGIIAVGAGADGDSARRAQIVQVGGLRLAFLGFVDVPSEGPGFQRSTWEAGPDRPGVSWASLDGIALAVQAAKKRADLVIVLLHTGVEGNAQPSAAQVAYARAAIDAGAALVLGSHPHVLQPVVRYGEGVIAYSLGNFVFDGFDGDANTSSIFEAVLTANGVESWRMIPVSIVDGLPFLAR